MTSEDLSANDLSKIEDRLKNATDGPWEAWIEGRDHVGGDSVIRTPKGEFYLNPGVSAGDLDFIACARQDIPRLLSELYSLRNRLSHKD